MALVRDEDIDEAESIAHLVSPLALTARITPGFRPRTHQKVISDAIVRAFNGTGRTRIAVSIPPQEGKTTITSIGAPAWVIELHSLGLLPGGLCGIVSYEDSLAMSWSTKTRRLMEERPDIFTAELRKDMKAASYWETMVGGGVIASGIGGTIVGRPLTYLGIDDPTKNMEQAQSERHRTIAWDFWQSVGIGRLQPWSVVCVSCTRWRDDDLIGRLISDEYEGDPDDWEYIRIPAVAEEDDPLGREIGEPLIRPQADQSMAEAKHEMEKVKASVSVYIWNTLWQQNPVDPAGSIFLESKWRYYGGDLSKKERYELPDPGEMEFVIMSWDMAFKDESKHDWVVGQCWAAKQADRFLIDEVRGHWGFTETIARVNSFAKDIRAVYPRAQLILVEDKANGPAVVNMLRSRVGGLVERTPEGSKISRANACQPLLNGGNLYLPAPSDKPWIREYTKELGDFPNANKDDRVDATTQALIYFMDLPTWGDSEMSDVEEIILPSSIQSLAGRKTRPPLPTGIASLRGR